MSIDASAGSTELALDVRRRLGWTDLEVCPIGLGTMQFGWTATDVGSMQVLDHYLDLGGNLIDTANMYGGDQSLESFARSGRHVGVSEDIIGRWQRSRDARDRIVLATKVRARMWEGEDGEGLRPAHIVRAVEDSLRRLRTDHVDLVYAHWPDPDADPSAWLDVFGRLVESGKVRYVATSNFVDFAGFGDLLSPLIALAGASGQFPRLAAEQTRYNLLNRSEYEANLQRIALQNDLGIVTYSSLASGFLAGAWEGTESGDRAAFVEQYRSEQGMQVLQALREIGAQAEIPMASVALAWSLAQPGITSVLIGADVPGQIDECAPAARFELRPSDIERLSSLSWDRSEPEFVNW